MANFTALKTAINNAIKTNGNEEITGAILQAILDAMVETLGDSAINDLENAITTEVTNRENAVGGVAEDLAAEALARANKDNQLDNRINQEEYNRLNADAALSRTVDQGFQTLNSQMTALNAAISALNAAYQNGYLYGGIATPSSSPSNNKCFYIALQGGTYTNFGGVGVIEGINILKNDSGWKVEHIYDQRTLLNEFYLLRQQVIQAITSIEPIVIEGDVTNAPDEEDLTSNANHLLQFKNNAYNPLDFSGLGRKYLRKNIAPLSDSAAFNGFVEGVTAEATLSGTPTQIFWDRINTRFVGINDGVYYLDWTDSDNYIPASTSLVYMYNGTPYQWTGSDFIVNETEVPNLVNCLTQDMINEANTIYIIRYDYTLKEDITIPANCVLEFDGGSISGNGTVTGTNTGINASFVKIFNTNVTLAGTWNISKIYPEWFYNGSGSWNNAIQKAINLSSLSGVVLLTQDSYYIEAVEDATLIVAKNNAVVVSYKRSRLYTDTSVSYRTIIGDTSAIGKFTIKGVWFDQRQETHTTTFQNCCLKFESCENIHIEGCYFNSLSTNTIGVNNPITCKYCCIKDNHIQFFTGISDYYDCSCIYTRAAFINVEGNVVLGSPNNYFVGGIEVHGFNTIATNNTIKYGNIGFYVNNDIPTSSPFYSDEYIKNGQILISDNKFDHIETAFSLWSETTPPWATDGRIYPELQNVNILNNIGEYVNCVVSFTDAETGSYRRKNNLKGLLVQGNNFRSTQMSIRSSTSPNIIANRTAINIDSYMEITDVVIKGNTFIDFPKLVIFNRVNYLNLSKKQEMLFVDNICINCNNYIISEEGATNILPLLSAITAGYGDLAFRNNIFNFSNERIVYPILYRDMSSGTAKVSYSGNKFSDNCECRAAKPFLNDAIDKYLKSISATPNETLNLNEYAINTDKTIVKCTQKGTKRSGTTFPATKITSLGTNNGWYISPKNDSDNINFVKIGDYLNITGFTDTNTSFNGVQAVWARCNGCIFTEFVGTGGTQKNVGTEIDIPSLAFRGYVVS